MYRIKLLILKKCSSMDRSGSKSVVQNKVFNSVVVHLMLEELGNLDLTLC